jgi:hypothetical protein
MRREREPTTMAEQVMTRRVFLRTSGIVALTLVALPSPSPARGTSFRAVARGRVDLTAPRRAKRGHG